MKKYSLLFLVILFAACKSKTSTGANGVTYRTALEYNDYIIHRQDDIMKDIIEYSNSAKISIDEADKKLDVIVNDLTDKMKDIQGMPAYNNDSSFRDAAVSMFKFYKTSFSTDFKEMHQVKRKVEAGTATDEEKKQLEGFSEYVGTKERPMDEKLKEAQTKFAKDNNLSLKENDMKDKMDDMKNGK